MEGLPVSGVPAKVSRSGTERNGWMQFRVVQKCLLSKFREARPGSVDALSAVMEETYDHLVELSDMLVELETSQRAARSNLSCAVQLVQLCIRYMHPWLACGLCGCVEQANVLLCKGCLTVQVPVPVHDR